MDDSPITIKNASSNLNTLSVSKSYYICTKSSAKSSSTKFIAESDNKQYSNYSSLSSFIRCLSK